MDKSCPVSGKSYTKRRGKLLLDLALATVKQENDPFSLVESDTETDVYDYRDKDYIPLSASSVSKMGTAKPASKQQPRGISEDSKQTILTKLCQIMPPHRLYFWEHLSVSQSQDAIDDD
ncbi:hypothetical protein ILUMI_13887 [Ignelater luminosus]|uniref:Uncharacterized protein n=1 Tax=Ignelater luminosus TaxID=2038154 RepID=A0A8K0G892_IGNLU|nr:hypothetical protein ILUMI_13887 [Ignelater luminosus]